MVRGDVDMTELEKTEKITINIGLVDLGQIDLLVNEGFYAANRTDFIRTAIRRQLRDEVSCGGPNRDAANAYAGHPALQQAGPRRASRRRPNGRTARSGARDYRPDVSPELALATITSVEVLGAFRAPRGVKDALAPRTV